MRQEVLLALLAKEPSQGYQLRARLDEGAWTKPRRQRSRS
jgi:DNA-binding PadR family transcriptional regulator